ncbi:hypothetical protein [Paraglaciecola arctica]|uniref:Uncharacterized protein n=1 Tax=Paraglaciecola arctica BSs20135 TaxID=493475 RepID=K6Z6F1_9ALTE|nr:hypothetical protein [Paraglaciecola arctica]GAC19020.1 hypothetical protein GARC_2053 [Paraglaciecola arctica BSs20135]
MTVTYLAKTKNFEETTLYINLKTQVAGMTPESGEAFDDVLVLKDKTNHTFNFGWFDLPAFSSGAHYTITVDGQKFSIKTSTLAWIQWCDAVINVESNKNMKIVFQNLLTLFAFLKQENINTVTAQSLSAFLEIMLTHSVNEKGLSKRMGVNGVALFRSFDPHNIAICCKSLGMQSELIQAISNKKLIRSLNELLLSHADMSYADYSEGASFNFLTLDIGQHYINHLNELFNEQFFRSYAVAQVMNQKSYILGGYVDSHHNLKLIRAAFLGTHSEEQKRMISANQKAFNEINKRVALTYESHYMFAVKQFALFSDSSLETLIGRLGLASNEENKSFVKSLLSIGLAHSSISEQQLIDDFTDSLNYLADCSKLSINKFEVEKKNLTEEIVKRTVIVRPDTNISSIAMFDTTIGRFGFTNIMALLGWRESEYTFPETAIHLSRNHDVLDQVRYPIRFQVKWKVPKTAGETKINREITINSYILLKQLQALHCSNDTQAMLFKSDIGSQDIDIGVKANVASIAGWQHFTDNYIYFVELDMLDKLQVKVAEDILTMSERATLLELIERYPPSSKTQNLRDVMRKVRADLPKLIAAGIINSNNGHTGTFLINAYCNKTMSHDVRVVWDERLSHEQKEYLGGLAPNEKIDRGSLNDIFNTIKSDCAYPTPHAFRHIWAECVYRRYSGDVGWLIRTNFKHFGGQFFRRYLREKHMQTSEELAKRRVISSILTSHLHAMKSDRSRDFGGKMDVYLRRILKQTKVVTSEQYGHALREFAHLEIEDIKANPWGFCMLKSRNKHRAKCAEEGIPQRDKAGVEFCIGCTNHLVEQEHVAFIIINIANHVTALKQPMPLIFKAESQRIVKETIKTLRQLDKNNKAKRNERYIEDMQSALNISNEMEAIA